MAMGKLNEIEHIVVLMMENRSFDHLLGYLKLKGEAVDGLKGDETNPDSAGTNFAVSLLNGTKFPVDPHHDWDSVHDQIKGPNLGFVKNFETLKPTTPPTPPGLVMGYYDERATPVYRYLFDNFVVCDKWFSSLPGPTIPNRCYALAGTSGGRKNNPSIGGMIKRFGMKTIFKCLDDGMASTPIGDRWAYYYEDLAMLWLFKGHLTDGRIQKMQGFFNRVKAGSLPALSWIDPNFGDIGSSNDDHPPKSDLIDGQRLVASVYNALVAAPLDLWKRTLLVVTYDEHGGFYDHVNPPAAVDDNPSFRQFGVRVPAFVISPWVTRGVDSAVRDHTSILKTVLKRFAPSESLTTRVDKAKDLDSLLDRSTPLPVSPPAPMPAAPRIVVGAMGMARGVRAAGAKRPAPSDIQLTLRKARPTAADLAKAPKVPRRSARKPSRHRPK
jgi:phospholipase C